VAFPEQTILGAFNDRRPDFREARLPLGMARPSRNLDFPQDYNSESHTPEGLLGDGLRSFPYADLIREHLARGRILAAQKLLEFARDMIPSDSKLIKALAPPRITRIDSRDVDRTREFRWLTSNGAKYRGQWVALVGDNLVASAATLAKLLSELRSSPPPSKPLIHHLD
jgi:Family of unknown function (DUF5678)